MHREVWDWIRQKRLDYPHLFNGKRVLECGSLVMTYSPRALFPLADYTGIDCHAGPGVDVVSLVHEYEPPQPFDVVVSMQMLEHDPYWRESLAAMVRFLKRGGHLFLTFAGPGYPEHSPEDTPEPGYYENRGMAEVVDVLRSHFAEVDATTNGLDVRIHGRERRVA